MDHGRLHWFEPSELDDEQKQLYDAIVGGPRSTTVRAAAMTDPEGRLYGPFNALLVAPELGDAVQTLGARVRFTAPLSARGREIATLEVARRHESGYEWFAHVQLGRAAGLSEEEIEALQRGADAGSFSDEERLIRRTVRHLVDDGDLTDETFRNATEALGEKTLLSLVVLVGHYELISRLLAVYRVPLPDGSPSAFFD